MFRNIKQIIISNSIRTKLIFLVLLLTLPLIMMLIYNNTYAIQVVRSQVSESYKYLLSTYITQVDTDLTAARKFVLDVLALDRNFLAMEQANSDDVYYFSMIQMAQDLQQ